MKFRKTIAVALVVIVALATLFTLASCVEKETKEQKFQRIKQTYLNCFFDEKHPDLTVDDVNIVYYVGEYNHCDVAMLEGKNEAFLDAIVTETISGVDFVYPNSNVLRVFRKDKFYTLQEAFDSGFLSQDDMVDIGTKYAELRKSTPQYA